MFGCSLYLFSFALYTNFVVLAIHCRCILLIVSFDCFGNI